MPASSRGDGLGDGAAAAGAAGAEELEAAALAAAASLPAGVAIAGASAPRHPAETSWLCCTRHCSDACVPVGTLEHTLI